MTISLLKTSNSQSLFLKGQKSSDYNRTQTNNHLIYKRTLNALGKLAKWLRSAVSTYKYGAFDCMFLSRHVRVLEWICTP